VKDCNNRAVGVQALEKQDEQIEELETSAAEMQQELANANENLEQQASTMQKVRQLHTSPEYIMLKVTHRSCCTNICSVSF